MILRNIQGLNYAGGVMCWSDWKRRQNKGMGDEDSLIANAYQILFLNYFADSYIFDVMDSFRKDKAIYRHMAKPNIDKVLDFIRKYDARVYRTMGDIYNEKFSDMSMSLQDSFQKMLDRLEAVSIKACREKGTKNPEASGKMQVCIMLNEHCSLNLADKVAKSMDKNPALAPIVWTSHAVVHPWLMKIDDYMKNPNISKDLEVMSVFERLQKTWNDADFLGEHIGDSVLDETEYEKIELSQLMKKQKKAV